MVNVIAVEGFVGRGLCVSGRGRKYEERCRESSIPPGWGHMVRCVSFVFVRYCVLMLVLYVVDVLVLTAIARWRQTSRLVLAFLLEDDLISRVTVSRGGPSAQRRCACRRTIHYSKAGYGLCAAHSRYAFMSAVLWQR